jgi:hypothetical protein
VEDDIKLVFNIDEGFGIVKVINDLFYRGAIEILGFFAGSLSILANSLCTLIKTSGAYMLGDILCKGRVPEAPKERIFLAEFLLDPIRLF